MPQLKYSRDEIAAKGEAIFEQKIRSSLGREHEGDYLATDIVTGSYEIAPNELEALQRAQEKSRDSVLYLMRVGSPTIYRLSHSRKADS